MHTMTEASSSQLRRSRILVFAIAFRVLFEAVTATIALEESTCSEAPSSKTYQRWDYFDSLRRNRNATAYTSPNNTSHVIRVVESDGTSHRLCHLAAFLALSDGKTVRGDAYDKTAVVLMAVHHFNNRFHHIIPQLNPNGNGTVNEKMRNCDLKLTAEIFDTRHSPLFASRQLFERVLDSEHQIQFPSPISLVGAYRSAVSSPLSKMSGSQGIMQVSYSSTSTEFENKGEHRFFGRVVSSVNGDAAALVDYLANVLHVSHLGIIYVKESYGSSFQTAIQRAARHLDEPIHTASVPIDYDQQQGGDYMRNDIRNAVAQLKALQYRCFFGVIFDMHYNLVMTEAYQQGIAGDDFLWLFGDAIESNLFQHWAKYPVGSPLAKVSHGVGFLEFTSGIPGMAGYDRFLSEWEEMKNNEAEKYIISKQADLRSSKNVTPSFHITGPPNMISIFLYDAVIALGLAACHCNTTYFETQDLFDSFAAIEFDGASGKVLFDRTTGTREYSSILYTISNVVAKEPDIDGVVSFSLPITAVYTLDGWTGTDKPFNYTDKTLKAPGDLPATSENANIVGTALLVVGLTLAGLIMLFSFVAAAYTFFYRKRRIIRASQPEFLITIYVGSFVMASSILSMSLQEPVPERGLDIACMATPWLLCIGFVVSFSALLSKMLRTTKLYGVRRFRRVTVKARDVFLPVVCLVASNIIVLVAWTIVAPLRWERVEYISVDEFGRSLESYGHCDAEDRQALAVFLALLGVINVSCLAFANYYSFKTRNIKTRFNESKYIAASMATILQAVILGIPVFAVGSKYPPARFLIYSVMVSIACGSLLIPLFLSKRMMLQEKSCMEMVLDSRNLRHCPLEALPPTPVEVMHSLQAPWASGKGEYFETRPSKSRTASTRVSWGALDSFLRPKRSDSVDGNEADLCADLKQEIEAEEAQYCELVRKQHELREELNKVTARIRSEDTQERDKEHGNVLH